MESHGRISRLADVAELYYIHDLTQAEIAARTGITRTTVSRMLSEARDVGVVHIRVERPVELDHAAAAAVLRSYPMLDDVRVIETGRNPEQTMQSLGEAAAVLLDTFVRNDLTIGVTWGRSLAATANALEPRASSGVRVVQLAGAVAGDSGTPQEIAQTIARKLSGTAVFVNAPFIVEHADLARSLVRDPSNRPAFALAAQASVAVVGIGSNDEHSSSLLVGGHLRRGDLRLLAKEGAVGDVGGQPIDENGRSIGDFAERIVGLPERDFRNIPVRVGVAGGLGKTRAIRAALSGGFLSHLVTDTAVAEQLVHN